MVMFTLYFVWKLHVLWGNQVIYIYIYIYIYILYIYIDVYTHIYYSYYLYYWRKVDEADLEAEVAAAEIDAKIASEDENYACVKAMFAGTVYRSCVPVPTLLTGNTNWRERLSTDDLLIKV
jgi:hypothetical protein